MIRIVSEGLGIVMTLDSKEEIDSIINMVERNRLMAGHLKLLGLRKKEDILTALKTVRDFKETEGQSYPALASWMDDKIDPGYHDELTDRILEMAQKLYKREG